METQTHIRSLVDLLDVLADSSYAKATVTLAPQSWNPDLPRLALVNWSWADNDRDELVWFLKQQGFVAVDRVATITVQVMI